jgi:hypothetical protein
MAKKTSTSNTWKIVSIIMIAVFVIMLVGAVIRTYMFRPSFQNLSPVQSDAVKSIAIGDMNARGVDPQNYSITADNIRMVNAGGNYRNVTEVSFYNDNLRYSYIIDVDTGNILMYSKTESFGLGNFSENRPKPGFFELPPPRWSR